MLQEEPGRTAAGIYGAFRTSSALEETPSSLTGNASLFGVSPADLKSATSKDECAGWSDGGSVLALLPIQQTARNIPLFKLIQFLMIVHLFAGAFFPNHRWFRVVMINNHMAALIVVLLSGILTHHRYRRFFDVSSLHAVTLAAFLCPAMRAAYRRYFRQRVVSLLPYHVLALMWALPLTFIRGHAWSVRSLLSTFSLTSSLQTFYPLANSTPTGALNLPALSFLPLGETLLYCWLLYPFVCVSALLVQSLCLTRTPRNGKRIHTYSAALWAIGLPLIVAFVTLKVLNAFPLDPATTKDAKDRSSDATAAVWFVNPLFKFPVFLCGVAIAELLYALGWAEFSTTAPARPPAEKPHSVFTRWILPFVPDALIFFVFSLVSYEPATPTSHVVRNIAKAMLHVVGYQNVSVTDWIVRSPWLLLPVFCLMLFLYSSPFAYRSLTSQLLCQDPIMAVLPGRTAIALSYLSCLILYTIPTHWRERMLVGEGLFVLLFFWLLPAISSYYYLYQPWHLWLSLKRAIPPTERSPSGIALGGSDSPDKKKLEEKDTMVEDYPTKPSPLDSLKVLTSPHYDPMYPNAPDRELRVYQHLVTVDFEINRRRYLGFWSWFVAVFVATHYIE